mmetsp:Transcript_36699/g.84678  ORF Transcript_36699/g.84678 Transcript_36699/m.84678 type:complete len:589 (+) Transcript_36699:49-1815(+)
MAEGAQDIFVSTASATKEFGGVLESHNALAQKLVELQKQLEALSQSHEELAKAAADKQAKEDERHETQVRKQDEEHGQVAEQLKALQVQLEEQGNSQKSSENKLAELEESSASNVKSLQLALDELGSHQAELKTRVLPKWEAELSSQIKKLEKDVLALRHSTDGRADKLEKSLASQQEQLLSECSAVESRLRPLNDEAAKRLDVVEVDLKKLPDDIVATATSGRNQVEELAAELRGSIDQLREFATAQDKSIIADFTEAYGRRIANLEGALKQVDFERLTFADRATKELESLAKELEKLGTCDERHEATIAEVWSSLDQKDEEHRNQLEKVAKEIRSELASCESRTSDIAQSCSKFEERQDAGHNDLLRRLEGEVQRLEGCLQKQADTVVNVIRGDEGERLKVLEEELKELSRQRLALAERLDQEHRDRKAELDALAGGTEKRAAAVELVANARFESVRRALDDLVVEFQGYVTTEKARSMDVARLEALVRALEVRVWPWRNSAKERPSSPTNEGHNGHHGPPIPPGRSKYHSEDNIDWQDWIKTTRPATARSNTDKDSGKPGPVVGSPVGPALTAVRSRPGHDRAER